jgi:hypothetical protein
MSSHIHFDSQAIQLIIDNLIDGLQLNHGLQARLG